MHAEKHRRIVGVALFPLLVALLSCSNSTQPDPEPRLELTNGAYDMIASSATETTCAIEFSYAVTGTGCSVGGYHIKWDASHSGQVDWYMKQRLAPQQTYVMADTFRLSHELTTDPVVTMAGYMANSSEEEPGVVGEITLKRK